MPSHAELAGRLLLAAALSGLIGLEREITDKTAGLRTHISVALGSCLFGIVSAYGFTAFGDLTRSKASYSVDPTRIASTVVTGIGFLGGGAILKHGATVRGLTTAGSLWVTAAVGVAAGAGGYFVASVTTAALLVALVGLRGADRWIDERLARRHERAALTLAPGAEASDVIAALYDLTGITVLSLSVRRLEDRTVVQADLVGHSGINVEAALAGLAGRGDISEVDVG